MPLTAKKSSNSKLWDVNEGMLGIRKKCKEDVTSFRRKKLKEITKIKAW